VPVSRLTLTEFRSYSAATIAPGPGFVLLSGENGAGKTNVLEAVSLLSPGRGLRGAALSEMARIGGGGSFAVAARLGEIEIGTGTLATAPDRRQVRINGAAASVNSLSEWLSVLWLTPAMDRLFLGTTGDRRRFLDRLVLALEPGHAHHAARYEAAMRARNKLLADDGWDEAWVASLEAAMAEHGAAIAEARARAVAALDERLDGVPDDQFSDYSMLTLMNMAEGDGATRKIPRRQALAEQIAERLCITPSYLRAIEADDVQSLPGAFFYKSFALQYAAILEIDAEMAGDRYPELAIAPGLMLHYPAAAYLFVAPHRPELAAELTTGLEAAVADGSFQRLHREQYGAVVRAHPLKPAQVLKLSNPLLPPETPLQRRELWLQPGETLPYR